MHDNQTRRLLVKVGLLRSRRPECELCQYSHVKGLTGLNRLCYNPTIKQGGYFSSTGRMFDEYENNYNVGRDRVIAGL